MSDYLLHQTASGIPVGVYTETESYYDPTHTNLKAYGALVVAARGSAVEWEDWIDQLSDSTPTPTAMWTVYPSTLEDLEAVLDQASADTSFD
jgi:hypothetical protein